MSQISNSKALWTIVFEVLNILPGSPPFSNEDKPIRSTFIEMINIQTVSETAQDRYKTDHYRRQ